MTGNAFGSAWLPDSKTARRRQNLRRRRLSQAGPARRAPAIATKISSSRATPPARSLPAKLRRREHCVASGSSPSAVPTLVRRGSPPALNTVVTCNDDGSVPSSGGTPCANNQTAKQASQRPRLRPGTYFCKDSNIYYCQWDETTYLSQNCNGESKCELTGNGGATCEPLSCSPSTTACLGNKIGTCAADGESLSAVTKDCTTTTSICTTAFTCEKTITDDIGVAESLEVVYPGTFIGNVIDVNSPRNLKDIQMMLVLGGARELRWVVYEQSDETFVTKIDKIVSNVSGSGFVSSPTLDLPLKAGKRYLFGVAISGGDGGDYLDAGPSRNVSFGLISGRVSIGYAPSFQSYVDVDYVSQMKLTTEPPSP